MVRTEQSTAGKAPAGAAPVERSPWVVSPGWDAFWLLSGLWLWVLYVGVGRFELGIQLFALLVAGKFALALVHSWATTYTVMLSPIFKEARKERWMDFVGIPLAILAGSMALGMYVAVGPTFEEGSRFALSNWGFALYLLLFFLGHWWHFAQQDFGVLSLYRTRKAQFRPIDRSVDLYYTRLMTLGVQPIVYLFALYELPWSQLLLSAFPLSHELTRTLAMGAVGVSIVASLGILGFELSKTNRSVPKLAYLTIIALHPITLYFVPNGYGLVYAFVYLFSHWLVAISLSWRINRNHAVQGPSPAASLAKYVLAFSAIMATTLAIHHLFVPAYPITATDFRGIIGHLGAWAGLAMGYTLGEQLVHYYCDRQLFKFKDPFVRATVGPLLR